MCPAEEFDIPLDDVPEIDGACGAGTSAAMDFSASEYLTTIDDAIALLDASLPEVSLSIPTADIVTVCEVHTVIRVGGCLYLLLLLLSSPNWRVQIYTEFMKV